MKCFSVFLRLLVVAGGSSHLCAVTDEEGQVIIFDTRPDPMARGAAMVKRKWH